MKKFYEVTVRIYGHAYVEIYTYDRSGIAETKDYNASQDCILLIDADNAEAAEKIAMQYADRESCDLSDVSSAEIYDTRFLGDSPEAHKDFIYDVRYEGIDV